MDYISYIRSKVGHDKVILNFDISNFYNEETLRLGFFSKEEIAELENVSDKHRLMLDEYFSDSFAMGL
ncbi:hypothetical protein D8887_04480 [Streptococcus sanguinis]|uniref:Uncharacterized protein n=1 Tax=Streptococcus sanguinis TaxID=1305 RepID=A0A3R9ICH1_STRSA|nr:hypothetical protein [Streptococcus sanguinis]RSI10988.1 hypothetical protein D8887_04480 [Streptococcus sanguinis]RSI30411.1 hypothetical protein D8877_07115 [Streptococcus sanguinis]